MDKWEGVQAYMSFWPAVGVSAHFYTSLPTLSECTFLYLPPQVERVHIFVPPSSPMPCALPQAIHLQFKMVVLKTFIESSVPK